jgi:hypothetical protein
MSKKVWFNWHCPHCEHRNREFLDSFQFEIPRGYAIDWKCDHCGEKSHIEIFLRVNGISEWERREKRKKEEIEKMFKGTKKDRGYCNKKG